MKYYLKFKSGRIVEISEQRHDELVLKALEGGDSYFISLIEEVGII